VQQQHAHHLCWQQCTAVRLMQAHVAAVTQLALLQQLQRWPQSSRRCVPQGPGTKVLCCSKQQSETACWGRLGMCYRYADDCRSTPGVNVFIQRHYQDQAIPSLHVCNLAALLINEALCVKAVTWSCAVYHLEPTVCLLLYVQDCAAAARSRSASPRRSPVRMRAAHGSADQHLLYRQRHHAANASTAGIGCSAGSAAAQHAKKCLFSSPPPAGSHRHKYCDQSGKQGVGSSTAGAWLQASGSPLRAVCEPSSSACQPVRGLRTGAQHAAQQLELPGGDCSSCSDDGESSSSSGMALSQVEAWQQALSNSLSRALNKLHAVP
jgi:hypothetical protein